MRLLPVTIMKLTVLIALSIWLSATNTEALKVFKKVEGVKSSSTSTKRIIWTLISHMMTTPRPYPSHPPPPTKPHPYPVDSSDDYCSNCACGVPNLKRRIVGGNETQVLQFPWMAALMNGNTFYCGGSLITDRHVMTAAHCTGPSTRSLVVKLLEHDRSSNFETSTLIRRVKSVSVYMEYDPENYDNDIAILHLDAPVNVSRELRPVCLPTSNSSFTGRIGIVTGWGALMEGGTTSSKLQQVMVPVLNNDECRRNYTKSSITDNMMCAGYSKGGMDSCQGDSGGPLHYYNGTISRYQQIGVVSWGEGCARPNKPGVYTRVNRFISWLRSHTKGGCFCDRDLESKH